MKRFDFNTAKHKHKYISRVDFEFPRHLYLIQAYDIEMHLKSLIPWIAFASCVLISCNLKWKSTVGTWNKLGMGFVRHVGQTHIITVKRNAFQVVK